MATPPSSYRGRVDATLFEVSSEDAALLEIGEDLSTGTTGIIQKLEALAHQIGQEQLADRLRAELCEMGVEIPPNEVYAKLALDILRQTMWNNDSEQAQAFSNWFALFPPASETRRPSFQAMNIHMFDKDRAPNLSLIMVFGLICARKGYADKVWRRVIPVVVRLVSPQVGFRYLGEFTKYTALHANQRYLDSLLTEIWTTAIRAHASAKRCASAVDMLRAVCLANIPLASFTYKFVLRHLAIARPESYFTLRKTVFYYRRMSGQSEGFEDDERDDSKRLFFNLSAKEGEELKPWDGRPLPEVVPLAVRQLMYSSMESAKLGKAEDVWRRLVPRVMTLCDPRFGMPYIETFLQTAKKSSTDLTMFADFEARVLSAVIHGLCIAGRTRTAFVYFRDARRRGVDFPVETHQVVIRHLSFTELPKVVRAMTLVLRNMRKDAGMTQHDEPPFSTLVDTNPRFTPREMAQTLRLFKAQFRQGQVPPITTHLAKWMLQYLDEGRVRAIMLLRNLAIQSGYASFWAVACMHVYHDRGQMQNVLLLFHRHFCLVDIPLSHFLVHLDRAKGAEANGELDSDDRFTEVASLPTITGRAFFAHRTTTAMVWSALTSMAESEAEVEELYQELLRQVEAWRFDNGNDKLDVDIVEHWTTKAYQHRRFSADTHDPQIIQRPNPGPMILQEISRDEPPTMVSTRARYEARHIVPFMVLFAREGMVQRCLHCISLMQSIGILPTALTLTLLIQAYARTRDFAKAELVLTRMCDGSLAAAYDRALPASPLLAFHMLVSGYMHAGKDKKARETLEWMKREVGEEMLLDQKSRALVEKVGLMGGLVVTDRSRMPRQDYMFDGMR